MLKSLRYVLLACSLSAISLGGCGGKASGPVIDTVNTPVMKSADVTPDSAAAAATEGATTPGTGTAGAGTGTK